MTPPWDYQRHSSTRSSPRASSTLYFHNRGVRMHQLGQRSSKARHARRHVRFWAPLHRLWREGLAHVVDVTWLRQTDAKWPIGAVCIESAWQCLPTAPYDDATAPAVGAGPVPVAPAVGAVLICLFLVLWWHRVWCDACVVPWFGACVGSLLGG